MIWSDIDGYFDFSDLYDHAIERAQNGAVFAEVGLYKGRSAAYMAQAIRASGKDIRFAGVDNFLYSSRDEFDQNMRACGVDMDIVVYSGDSHVIAEEFNDGAFDFVYIDADHSYEAVKRDIAAWLPKIKPGGIIAGHDRVREGVHRAVAEAFPGGFETMGVLSWLKRV